MLSTLGAVIRRLGTGLALLLTFLGRPERMVAPGAETVWLVAIAIAVWAGYDWLRAESGRSFDAIGLATVLGGVAVLSGILLAVRSPRRVFDVNGVIATLAAVAVWIGLAAMGVVAGWDTVMDRLELPRSSQVMAWHGLQIASGVWALLVALRLGQVAGRDADGNRTAPRLGLWVVAACLLGVMLLPLRPIVDGESADEGSAGLIHTAVKSINAALAPPPSPRPRLPRVDVEQTYYRQPALLRRSLAALAPSRPDRPEIYFLGAATFAGQAVFMREVQQARAIVDERLGTHQRSLLLVNNRDTLHDVPLANASNLEAALGALAGIMDPDKDLLFLYITSHGSPGEIAVQLPGFSPNQITPELLANLLARSRIKHRLVVLSACYSGSFIPALADPGTVVLTAARPDRTSFGCSDEREWTYFGDALFNHGLRQTTSITEAFEQAKVLIAEWEKAQKFDPSEPQIAAGAVAKGKLDEIAARLAGERDGAALPAGGR